MNISANSFWPRPLSWLFLVFSMAMFSGCEKTFSTVLDIDIPHQPIIAFECMIGKAQNQTMFDPVTVSSTVSVTGSVQPFPLNSAVPYIFENNVLVDSFQYTNFFQTDFENFISGKSYKIRVSVPSYKSIEAEDIMPSTTNVVSTSFTKEAKKIVIEGNSQPTMMDEIKIVFKDEAGQKDYYEFQLQLLGGGGQGGQYFCLYSNDLDLEPEFIEDDPFAGTNTCLSPRSYLQDVNFNGREKTLVIYAPSFLTDQINTSWQLNVGHMSENYYKFKKTRALYNTNEGNPFAEPVQIHSNVINGVGIFALKKDTIIKL